MQQEMAAASNATGTTIPRRGRALSFNAMPHKARAATAHIARREMARRTPGPTACPTATLSTAQPERTTTTASQFLDMWFILPERGRHVSRLRHASASLCLVAPQGHLGTADPRDQRAALVGDVALHQPHGFPPLDDS